MLEEFAIGLANSGEVTLSLGGLLVSALGFAIAVYVRRGSLKKMRRVTYLIWIAFLMLYMSALQLVWLVSFDAMQAGMFWVVVAIVTAGLLLFGYGIGHASHARSVSAYGSGRSAWLGAIPILNLILIFARPVVKSSRGALGLGIDVVLIVGALFVLGVGQVISEQAEQQLDQMAVARADDPDLVEADIARSIKAIGLEETLRLMVSGISSQRIDEATLLLGVGAYGNTITYSYEFDTTDSELTFAHRSYILQSNCNDGSLSEIIAQGAVIKHIYSAPNGNEIGSVSVSKEICSNFSAVAVPQVSQPSSQGLEDRAEALLQDGNAGNMYRALLSYYPSEATFLLNSAVAVLELNPSEEEAFSKMSAAGAEIRRRHASGLKSAPDASLGRILDNQFQIIKALQNDPITCNRVIMFGVDALPEADRSRIIAIMDSTHLLVRAMYEGETSPVVRSATSEEDWDALGDAFYAAGGSDAELDLVIEPDLQDPQLCGAMLRFVSVVGDARFEGSDRVRADMVSGMYAG